MTEGQWTRAVLLFLHLKKSIKYKNPIFFSTSYFFWLSLLSHTFLKKKKKEDLNLQRKWRWIVVTCCQLNEPMLIQLMNEWIRQCLLVLVYKKMCNNVVLHCYTHHSINCEHVLSHLTISHLLSQHLNPLHPLFYWTSLKMLFLKELKQRWRVWFDLVTTANFKGIYWGGGFHLKFVWHTCIHPL